MPSSDARDPGGGALLERLGRLASGYKADPGLLAEDLGLLREAGYLKIALPVQFGGAGRTLPEVACSQRRLAYRAPAAALATSAHHQWVGAAAAVHASGDSSADWLLSEVAQGALFGAGGGEEGNDLIFADPGARAERAAAGGYRLHGRKILTSASPAWDWLGVHGVDDSEPARPKIVHAFIRQADLGCRTARVLPPGPPDDPFIAGVFGWGLPLAGEISYAIARRAFDLAIERACPHAPRGRGPRASAAGCHPTDRWPVAEAALRLDAIRGQLDTVLHGWQQRAAVGGAAAILDPGGQWLIRLFTVRRAAADCARRVAELAEQISGGAVSPAPDCAA
jgi:alkylation response protein AidB-like acyl-CoA dehydrogenase